MKKQSLFFLLIFGIMFQSCWLHTGEDDDNMVEPFPISSSYNPVIVKRQVLETSTIFQEPQTIVNSGKIYVKDAFLFINEKNQGFHVFNNSNPANPENIGFLKVLGSSDLAIKNDIIYVNNATDLIAIQTNMESNTIEITKRIPNTFPQMFSPEGFQYMNLEEDDIIVDWTLID
jgi:hypothetical protein